jgi:hypothetical protein
MRLHRKYVDTPLAAQFPRPAFKVGAPAAGCWVVGWLCGCAHLGVRVGVADSHVPHVAVTHSAVCWLTLCAVCWRICCSC